MFGALFCSVGVCVCLRVVPPNRVGGCSTSTSTTHHVHVANCKCHCNCHTRFVSTNLKLTLAPDPKIRFRQTHVIYRADRFSEAPRPGIQGRLVCCAARKPSRARSDCLSDAARHTQSPTSLLSPTPLSLDTARKSSWRNPTSLRSRRPTLPVFPSDTVTSAVREYWHANPNPSTNRRPTSQRITDRLPRPSAFSFPSTSAASRPSTRHGSARMSGTFHRAVGALLVDTDA